MLRGQSPFKLACVVGVRLERDHAPGGPDEARELARDHPTVSTDVRAGLTGTNKRPQRSKHLRLVRTLLVDDARDRPSKAGSPEPLPERRRREASKRYDESPHKAGYRTAGDGR